MNIFSKVPLTYNDNPLLIPNDNPITSIAGPDEIMITIIKQEFIFSCRSGAEKFIIKEDNFGWKN